MLLGNCQHIFNPMLGWSISAPLGKNHAMNTFSNDMSIILHGYASVNLHYVTISYFAKYFQYLGARSVKYATIKFDCFKNNTLVVKNGSGTSACTKLVYILFINVQTWNFNFECVSVVTGPRWWDKMDAEPISGGVSLWHPATSCHITQCK